MWPRIAARNSWRNVERTTNQCPRILRLRCYSQFKAFFLSFQRTPDISSGIFQEKNVLNRTMKLASSFVRSRGTSEYVSKYASQSGEVLDVLKQLLEEMNSYRIGTPEDV